MKIVGSASPISGGRLSTPPNHPLLRNHLIPNTKFLSLNWRVTPSVFAKL
jgi:hypothetical protein